MHEGFTMRKRAFVSLVVGAVVLALAACTNTTPRGSPKAAFQPTAIEQQTAISFAEQAITTKKLRTDDRLYFVSSELVREKDEDKDAAARLVLVTHYRYDGDLTIKTLVNTSERRVVSVDAVAHVPTPLSAEEFAIAKQLALSDPQIKEALSPFRERLVIEPLVLRTMSEGEQGRRVVRLLFKVGSDYLRQPIVNVDLTVRKVMIESPTSGPGTPH